MKTKLKTSNVFLIRLIFGLLPALAYTSPVYALLPQGSNVTSDLKIAAVINTADAGEIEAVWYEGGRGDTQNGDKVVWGFFYANPQDVKWGNSNNPDLYAKIWFDKSGRLDVNFFHVSKPDIQVFSAYKGKNYVHSTTTMVNRYIRHYYNDNGKDAVEVKTEDGVAATGYSQDNAPLGQETIQNLRIGAVIKTDKGPIEAGWRFGGQGKTDRGDQVAWGYFFANPSDVEWGSVNNPDLFVKIWFNQPTGEIDVNFFHVSVPDIEVYSAQNFDVNGKYPQSGTTILADRYIKHNYGNTDKNHPPKVFPIPLPLDVSQLGSDSISYVNLIGTDEENDTLAYELRSPSAGAGYEYAYIEPPNTLVVKFKANFIGTILLKYRATDGRYFSEEEAITIDVSNTPINVKDHGLGSQDIDPRLYATFDRFEGSGDLLGAPGGQPTLPRQIDLSANFPRPGDQGRQGSCVAWAVGYAAKSYQERLEMNWSLDTNGHLFSPAFIYNQINGGRDKGSRIDMALDLLTKKGIATLATMPYNDTDFLTQPNAKVLQEAGYYKAKDFNVLNSVSEIKSALVNNLPAIVGIVVFGQLYDLTKTNAVYNAAMGSIEGGHAVTIVGYDDAKYGGAFKVINSWGTDWGDDGFFWLPYTFAYTPVPTPKGSTPILMMAFTVTDASNTAPYEPPPPPTSDLPNLQVRDWSADYDPKPGGMGLLRYSVTNTGTGKVLADTADISLVLSEDPTISRTARYVVYEMNHFEMESGTELYRDDTNAIGFRFPADVTAGTYWLAMWIDSRSLVTESNETDNISTVEKMVKIVNELPDLTVTNWYAEWDDAGEGTWEYEVQNRGVSAVPANLGWDVVFVMSPSDNVGQGNEVILARNLHNEGLAPDQRVESSPISFNMYRDWEGTQLSPGLYYVAIVVDSLRVVKESDEVNNASLSGDVIRMSSGRRSLETDMRSLALDTPALTTDQRRAYNGMPLPAQVSVRKVEIIDTPEGGRRMRLLEEDSPPVFEKQAKARDQVIFPVAERIAMPKVTETLK